MEKDDQQNMSLNMTLERALYKLAEQINKDVGIPEIIKKDQGEIEDGNMNELCACSIFLYDAKRDGFILRASTQGSSFLGTAQINLSPEVRALHEKGEPGVGISATALLDYQSILVTDIQSDTRFSAHNLTEQEKDAYYNSHYCEYSHDNVGSLIVVPIYFEEGAPPAGLLRIVRNRTGLDDKFVEADVCEIEKMIHQHIKHINSKIFLSQLIELGSYMQLTDLCDRAVNALRDILGAKGCSVFILDDKDFDITEDMEEFGSSNEILTYKCYGTTGLAIGTETSIICEDESDEIKNERYVDIHSPLTERASWYELTSEENQKSEEPLAMSITMGVVRARTCAFVENLHDKEQYDRVIETLFPDGYKIKRKKGRGKVSEKFIDDNGKYLGTGNILYAPMFYGAPDDLHTNVLGVVRIQKQRGEAPFTHEERHLFVSMVEHLSKAINFARLVEFLDNISKIKSNRFLYTYIVRNIPKFINLKDCALLVADPLDDSRFIVQAEWKKGAVTYKPDTEEYDIHDPERRGYSGWVAHERRILRFNGTDELEQLKKEYSFSAKRFPKHRKTEGKENGPYRFLGVPIPEPAADEKAFAVIRICSDENSSKLSKQSELELSLIARRIRPYISKAIEEEKSRIERDQLIEQVFSKDLQREILGLKKVACTDQIKSFLLNIDANRAIDKEIVSFLPELWEIYSQKNRQIKYIENFDFFNSNILSEIPFYRDHFVHQFVVYLIGLIIIDRFHSEFVDLFKNAYPVKNGDEEDIDYAFYVEQAWLITALFHDTAYPFEKLNSWLQRFVNKIVRDNEGGKKISIPIDTLLFRPQYIDRIDQLSEFLAEISVHVNEDKRKIRELLLTELSDYKDSGIDHGIIGALILIGDTGLSNKVIMPCASAIALHNKFLNKMNGYIVDLERHPLGFLLIYCDLIHEWGRSASKGGNRFKSLEEDAPCLTEIAIDEDCKKVVFKIEINDDTSIKYKIKEIDRVFQSIRSENIQFVLKLNEREDGWVSG